MDGKIDGLLEKLRTLDHDAYMAWCVLFQEIYDIDYDCIEWDSFAGAIYLLQGVIQDAIVARGWGCYQYHYDRETPGKLEFVYISVVGSNGEGDSPAEALLTAFVAALEAEAAR